MKKVVDGNETVFHYAQGGKMIAESEAAGGVTAEYVFLNNEPLAKIEGDDTYYYHNDHLMTPQIMTDKDKAVVWKGEFMPFGEVHSITGTITNNLRFPGQYYDNETGLHYNYFRDYEPQFGTYLEKDPLGLIDINYRIFPNNNFLLQYNHLYTYSKQNPLIFTDFFGLYLLEISCPECPQIKKCSVTSTIELIMNLWLTSNPPIPIPTGAIKICKYKCKRKEKDCERENEITIEFEIRFRCKTMKKWPT